MRTSPSRTSNSRVTGACARSIELPEAGNERRDAPLDRPHVEDLGDQRVARLGAAHRDRPVALLIRAKSMLVTRSSSLGSAR